MSLPAFDFNKITEFLLANPSYLEKINMSQAVTFIGSITDLQKFLIQNADGTKAVDWKSLLTDANAKLLIQKLINEQMTKRRFSRQALNFNSFINFLKPTVDRIQQQIQAQTNQFISSTMTSLLQQVSNSLFNGAPLDFSTIAQNFLNSLKNSILAGINTEFKFQAAQIIDLQFKAMYDLLAKLNQNQIAPQSFVNLLISNLENLKVQLQGFVPQISDIINNAINQYLLTPLLKPINVG